MCERAKQGWLTCLHRGFDPCDECQREAADLMAWLAEHESQLVIDPDSEPVGPFQKASALFAITGPVRIISEEGMRSTDGVNFEVWSRPC